MIFYILLLVFPTFCTSCTTDDYEFAYTNCDANGERWRVAVPKSGANCLDLPAPRKGLNCSFSCPAGHYLDLDSQSCKPCNAGFFSLGGGIRYEEFQNLPNGFTVENFDSSAGSDVSSATAMPCPKEGGWMVKDSQLVYTPTPCTSRLLFSANLVRPGHVEFTYRMPKNNRAVQMSVDVRNEQCQSYSDVARAMFMKYSRPNQEHVEHQGDWNRRRIDLKTGANVISWTVVNNIGWRYSQESIVFARLDVLGLAFTQECTPCPEGTYSVRGAEECKPCAPGYFSSKGSSQCGKCPESQYSGPKAEKCIDRPPCKTSDYYPVREPCLNGSSRQIYKKVLPAVCRDDLPTSARQPAPGPWSPCPKCNPGMAKGADGVCKFCEKENFSDGNSCQRCPVNTVPNYGYQYVQWDALPPGIVTKCEYINEDVEMDCDIGDAWIPSGSALTSAPSLQRGIALELILEVKEGFWNPLVPKPTRLSKSPVAQVVIVFETACADTSCAIYFIEDTKTQGQREGTYRFLAAFNGTQSRRVWSHTITHNTPARFLVAFLRSGVAEGLDSIGDEARIYTMNVTNVGHRGGQGGGASACLACPHSSSGEGCVPCPAGNYMHETTHLCVQCPRNTAINISSSRVGVESCIQCGSGLTSTDGVACVSNGTVSLKHPDNTTFNYDFSPWLQKEWTINGVRVFSREGSAYYHVFNITLFSGLVKCNEVFDESEMIGIMDQGREGAEGIACRITALPTKSANRSSIAYVSPLTLATRLTEITTSQRHGSLKIDNKVLEYEGVDNSSLPLDVFFWYDPIPTVSTTCPHGTFLVVVARCQPTKKTAEMRLPHTCPDGTCDGCAYVIILESSQSCPVCDADDYDTIRGECVGGTQTIHSIPKKHCVISGKAAASHEEACSVLTAQQRFLLMLLAISLIFLAAVLIVTCRTNRRLEYKYTKLIENRTGELPMAETCGLESDEDDETTDRVIFSKGRGSRPKEKFHAEEHENGAFISLDNDD